MLVKTILQISKTLVSSSGWRREIKAYSNIKKGLEDETYRKESRSVTLVILLVSYLSLLLNFCPSHSMYTTAEAKL